MGLLKCKHFVIQELVPPEIYAARGESAWELLDSRALITLDQLRDYFGPITVNNWHLGGAYSESGFRAAETKQGAKLSQHRYGRAFDLKPKSITAQELHVGILANPNVFPYLTTIEDIAATVTDRGEWVHVDVRNNSQPGIRVVKP